MRSTTLPLGAVMKTVTRMRMRMEGVGRRKRRRKGRKKRRMKRKKRKERKKVRKRGKRRRNKRKKMQEGRKVWQERKKWRQRKMKMVGLENYWECTLTFQSPPHLQSLYPPPVGGARLRQWMGVVTQYLAIIHCFIVQWQHLPLPASQFPRPLWQQHRLLLQHVLALP